MLKTLIKYVGIIQSAMMCAEDATTRPGHFKQREDGMKFNLLSFLTEGRVRERTSNWNDLRRDSMPAFLRNEKALEKLSGSLGASTPSASLV